jgi:hypothetical protein
MYKEMTGFQIKSKVTTAVYLQTSNK